MFLNITPKGFIFLDVVPYDHSFYLVHFIEVLLHQRSKLRTIIILNTITVFGPKTIIPDLLLLSGCDLRSVSLKLGVVAFPY